MTCADQGKSNCNLFLVFSVGHWLNLLFWHDIIYLDIFCLLVVIIERIQKTYCIKISKAPMLYDKLNCKDLYPEWPHGQGGCLECGRLRGRFSAEAAQIYTVHEPLRGYTAYEDGR